MTEYRAVLHTHNKLERPIQSVSLLLAAIEDWIQKTLIKYPDGEIILYQSEEREISRFIGSHKIKHLASNDCTQCYHSQTMHLLTCSSANDKKYGACASLNCPCNCYMKD